MQYFTWKQFSIMNKTYFICRVTAAPGCKGVRRQSDRERVSDAAKRTTATVNSTLSLRCDKKIVHITQTTGTIRSPNYPQGYEINSQCTWHVQVPRGFRIKVRFRRQFDLEDSPGCTKDYVMLSTSKQFRDPLIYCGGARPHGIITPQNVVWIRFHSDNATTGKGFYISYMSVDENECKRQVCTFPSLCRNTYGSYACDCPEGYANRGRKDSARCEDIDECKISNGRCEHKCVNSDGSYYCMCRRGFKQAPDGRRCRDKNECSKSNGGCSHFCVNSRSSYRCGCPDGYALHSDKKTCYPEISFYHNQYTVGVSENAQPNTVVTKVEARTFPRKHIITYALLSENLKKPSLFTINSRTGEIMVSGGLDIEDMRNFLLEVEASFQLSNTSGEVRYRTAKTFVLINIREHQAEESLSFTQASYYLRIPCNTSRDTTVYRVKTIDSDSGGNARTRYRFQRKLDHFFITNGGKIKTQRTLLLFCYVTPLKYFRTTVVVRDTAGVKRNAHALMYIVITPPGPLSKDIAGIVPGGVTTITRRQTSHFNSGAIIEQQKSNNFTAKHREN
ncbi:uncharacterized protein LOC144657480 isoform X2 [Oculina patagonica]